MLGIYFPGDWRVILGETGVACVVGWGSQYEMEAFLIFHSQAVSQLEDVISSRVCVCLHAQLLPTLCDPMDCNPPGSSVHRIFLARTLGWVAIFFSKGPSWPKDWTCISHILCAAGRFFTIEPPGRASQVVKNLPANAGDMRYRFDLWVGKIPWRRAWQPTAVFLPGESHGQRSLVGYSPRGHKESDMTEVTEHACTSHWGSPHIDLQFKLLMLNLKNEQATKNPGYWGKSHQKVKTSKRKKQSP